MYYMKKSLQLHMKYNNSACSANSKGNYKAMRHKNEIKEAVNHWESYPGHLPLSH